MVWLEVYLTENATQGELTPYVFTFSDNISVPGGAVQSKTVVPTYLHENVFKHEVFVSHQKIEELTTAFESFWKVFVYSNSSEWY